MHGNAPAGKADLLGLFSDRIVAALGLGFTSGIPCLLVYGTQSAWLSEARVPIRTLGLLSELTLAYKFKFVWAPPLDRYDAPLFSRLIGRRRGWIVVSQIAVMLALAGASGFAIEAFGFAWFFVWTSLIGAPVALLCWWVWDRQERAEPGPVAG